MKNFNKAALILGRKIFAGQVPVGYTDEEIKEAKAALEHERNCSDVTCGCWN